MYLHPLIHSELSRQRQHELSRLPVRRDPGSSSRPGKQTAAALGALLVATIAALALTSGALAATAKKPSHPNGTVPSWRVIQDGTGKITIRIGGRIVYVYYPAPAQPQVSSNTDASDDCVNYQVNCTDEQACQHWGVNCDRISNTSTDTPTDNQDSTASDSTNDASGQADNTSLQPLTEAVSDSPASQTATDADTLLAGLSTDEDC
jgi:hypothetical protein